MKVDWKFKEKNIYTAENPSGVQLECEMVDGVPTNVRVIDDPRVKPISRELIPIMRAKEFVSKMNPYGYLCMHERLHTYKKLEFIEDNNSEEIPIMFNSIEKRIRPYGYTISATITSLSKGTVRLDFRVAICNPEDKFIKIVGLYQSLLNEIVYSVVMPEEKKYADYLPIFQTTCNAYIIPKIVKKNAIRTK